MLLVMGELTQKDLENFLIDIAKDKLLFKALEGLGIYGSQEVLFKTLKNRLEYCMSYLNVDLPELTKRIHEYLKRRPEKNFSAINEELYQDEMHPIVMTIFYSVAEPFILRKIVKQEILYLAFKLEKIKNIFVGGLGCGEIIDSISKVSLIKIPHEEITIKGVDISISGIEFCKKRSTSYKFNIVTEVADLDYYNFADKHDLVELSEIIEHVREPIKLLDNISKCSKLILVTIPIMLDVPDHLHVFDGVKIFEMLNKAKLDVIYQTVRNGFFVRQFFYFALLKGQL